MIGYTCSDCGRTWPENYCPACRRTVDRSLLAAPLSSAIPISNVAGSFGGPVGAPPQLRDWPWERETGQARPLGSSSSETSAPFTFTGSASEYFRIWIVNVALTVVTLGIYAAWAKVSKRRYFWGNTQLGGRSFEYTGNAIAILKGNLIFAAGAICYYAAIRVQPLLAYASAGAIALIYPWLFAKAMRFNAHNTRHRNIRFAFHGSVGESYAVHLGLLLLFPLTLGLIWPYTQFRKKRYQLSNLSYGTARFELGGEVGPFYGYFFRGLGLLVGAFAVGFLVIGMGSLVARQAGSSVTTVWVTVILLYLVSFTSFALFHLYFSTRVTNYVLEHTQIEGVASLRSTLSVTDILGLEVVHVLAILGTLGLATPWAAVRRARYRWSHIEARLTGPIERVTAALAAEPGALGDVAADQFDIDISL